MLGVLLLLLWLVAALLMAPLVAAPLVSAAASSPAAEATARVESSSVFVAVAYTRGERGWKERHRAKR